MEIMKKIFIQHVFFIIILTRVCMCVYFWKFYAKRKSLTWWQFAKIWIHLMMMMMRMKNENENNFLTHLMGKKREKRVKIFPHHSMKIKFVVIKFSRCWMRKNERVENLQNNKLNLSKESRDREHREGVECEKKV